MKSGKRVLIVIIVSLILISSVAIVSASLKDWFTFGDNSEDLEGELAESARASVKVAPPSTPPIIYSVTSPGNDVLLNSCPSTTSVRFSFLATQGGFVSNLPDVSPLTYIRGNISNPVDLVTRAFSSCSYVGIVTCNVGGANQCKNYTCSIAAQYYDIPNSNWGIVVQMSSLSGPTIFGAINNTQSLQYDPNWYFTMSPAYVNWTNNPISLTDVKKEADNWITITNCGNVKIENGTAHYLRINATKLTGDSGNSISASNFTANDKGINSYCNSVGNFIEGNWYNLEFKLDKGITTRNLGFCLQQVPPVNVPQSFTTINNWVIENIHV